MDSTADRTDQSGSLDAASHQSAASESDQQSHHRKPSISSTAEEISLNEIIGDNKKHPPPPTSIIVENSAKLNKATENLSKINKAAAMPLTSKKSSPTGGGGGKKPSSSTAAYQRAPIVSFEHASSPASSTSCAEGVEMQVTNADNPGPSSSSSSRGGIATNNSNSNNPKLLAAHDRSPTTTKRTDSNNKGAPGQNHEDIDDDPPHSTARLLGSPVSAPGDMQPNNPNLIVGAYPRGRSSPAKDDFYISEFAYHRNNESPVAAVNANGPSNSLEKGRLPPSLKGGGAGVVTSNSGRFDEMAASLKGGGASAAAAVSKKDRQRKNSEEEQYHKMAAYIKDLTEDPMATHCGLGRHRPNCLQSFASQGWMLFWMCWYCTVQGLLVNGLVPSVLTSIERRFDFNTSMLGRIMQFYDIGYLLACIPVSYFGGRHSKPLFIGVGLLIIGCGSFLFSMPHIVSPRYTTESVDFLSSCPADRLYNPLKSTTNLTGATAATIISETAMCQKSSSNIAGDDPNADESQNNRYWYLFLFCFAHFLHGIGATPLFTLGVAYIDENVKPTLSSVYIGIYYAFAIFGPAIGFLLSGSFLRYHTDFLQDEINVKISEIDETDPEWVGAWWIGFQLASILCIVAVFPILSFPKILPSAFNYYRSRVRNETLRERALAIKRDMAASKNYYKTHRRAFSDYQHPIKEMTAASGAFGGYGPSAAASVGELTGDADGYDAAREASLLSSKTTPNFPIPTTIDTGGYRHSNQQTSSPSADLNNSLQQPATNHHSTSPPNSARAADRFPSPSSFARSASYSTSSSFSQPQLCGEGPGTSPQSAVLSPSDGNFATGEKKGSKPSPAVLKKKKSQVAIVEHQRPPSSTGGAVTGANGAGEVDDNDGKKELGVCEGLLGDFMYMPRACIRLFTNSAYMFITLAAAVDGLLITGLSAFMAKYLERQFNIRTSRSAMLIGCIMVPVAGLGTMFSGYAIKRFRMTCPTTLKYCISMVVFSLVLSPMFLVYCDHSPLVGVEFPYPVKNYSSLPNPALFPIGEAAAQKQRESPTTMLFKKNETGSAAKNRQQASQAVIGHGSDDKLISGCNADCGCLHAEYAPVCAPFDKSGLEGGPTGLDTPAAAGDERSGLSFYSPCYAGCPEKYSALKKTYTNCTCAPGGTVKKGLCESACSGLIGFLILFGPMCFCTFSVGVPLLSVVLRCVDHSERSFALGIQWILIRLIGTIPAPAVFGWLFDISCLKHYVNPCTGESGACYVYNNKHLADLFLAFTLIGQTGTLLFLVLALVFYRNKPGRDDPMKAN